MKVLITINGCHDTTMCETELSEQEFKIFIKIAKEINKYSTYQCEPSIDLYKNYKKESYGYLFDEDKDNLLKK